MAKRFAKLRQRFGIAAPKVSVRTHVPWYLRWLGIAVLLSFSAALAVWMYDAGRKFAGFDRAVNVTLGLPFLRTSVDHGTALSLAGTGKADASSLHAAIQLACAI